MEVYRELYHKGFHGILKEAEPSKAMERSRMLVTDRALPRSAPSIRLAHL